MSATFVTDIATVTGLTVLFLKPTVWIVPFALVSIGLIFGLPYTAQHFFPRYGNRVIEPEIKVVFACLFLLMWLGLRANSQAALPASLYGLSAGIIDRTQFSLLIAVVVLSAIVPTAIAQRFYEPRLATHRDLTAPVAPAPSD